MPDKESPKADDLEIRASSQSARKRGDGMNIGNATVDITVNSESVNQKISQLKTALAEALELAGLVKQEIENLTIYVKA